MKQLNCKEGVARLLRMYQHRIHFTEESPRAINNWLQKELEKLFEHLLEKQKKGFNKLIVKEIRIAQDEEKPTSRLTSLYNKLNK